MVGGLCPNKKDFSFPYLSQMNHVQISPDLFSVDLVPSILTKDYNNTTLVK